MKNQGTFAPTNEQLPDFGAGAKIVKRELAEKLDTPEIGFIQRI